VCLHDSNGLEVHVGMSVPLVCLCVGIFAVVSFQDDKRTRERGEREGGGGSSLGPSFPFVSFPSVEMLFCFMMHVLSFAQFILSLLTGKRAQTIPYMIPLLSRLFFPSFLPFHPSFLPSKCL